MTEPMASGKDVFTRIAQPPCAACHALRAAGSTAHVGPSLDTLDLDKQRVIAAVRGGVGVMPSYEDKLTAAQIDAVADYVVAVTKGKND